MTVLLLLSPYAWSLAIPVLQVSAGCFLGHTCNVALPSHVPDVIQADGLACQVCMPTCNADRQTLGGQMCGHSARGEAVQMFGQCKWGPPTTCLPMFTRSRSPTPD